MREAQIRISQTCTVLQAANTGGALMRRFFIFISIFTLSLLIFCTSLPAQDMGKIEQLMKQIHFKMLTGLEFQQKENFEAAAKEYEEALKLQEEFKKLVVSLPGFEKTIDDQMFQTHNGAALSYKGAYQPDGAIKHYAQCILIATKYNDIFRQIDVNCDIAELYRDSSNYLGFNTQLKQLENTIAQVNSIDMKTLSFTDTLSLLRVMDRYRCLYIDHIAFLYDMRKYDEALKCLNAEWFTQYNAALDRMDIDKFEFFITQTREKKPEWLLSVFNNCHAIYLDNINSHFFIPTHRGMCLRAKGDYEGALTCFNEAEGMINAINAPKAQKILASICDELAKTADKIDPQSSKVAQRVIASLKNSDMGETSLLFSINNRFHKGRTYMKMGDTKKAQEIFDGILNDCERLSPRYKKLVVPKILTAKGETLATMGNEKEAGEIVQKARQMCGDTPMLWGERIKTDTILGRIQENSARAGEARTSYERAIEEIEKRHSALFTGQTREEFFGEDIEPYEGMIRLLCKEGKGAESLIYAEKTKARSLAEQFGTIVSQRGLTEEQMKKYESLKLKMKGSYDAMAEAENMGGPENATRKVELEKRYMDLAGDAMAMFQGMGTDYKDIVCGSVVPVKEVQATLDGGTVILEYFYDSMSATSDHVYLWIITSSSVESLTLPIQAKDMENAIRMLRKSISEGKEEWTGISKKLYSGLIEPAEKSLKGKTRLVVSPYRQLHYLPFAALIDRNGDPLIKSYSLAYTPSLTALSLCQKKHPGLGKNLAAFALGNVSSGSMAPLPGTDIEVKAIRALYPDTTLLMGRDFTRESIPAALPGRDIVHFATHSVLNADNPKESGLVTSNGNFTVEEVFGLKLQSRLVILSACNTGLGKLFPGDDQVGLTRAFMFAGTPSILSSLWPVSDDSTVSLMTYFHKNLANHMDKAEALRQAELKLMAEYPKPFFWAPFILTGDWK
jgi:CHAT domain-containing protein